MAPNNTDPSGKTVGDEDDSSEIVPDPLALVVGSTPPFAPTRHAVVELLLGRMLYMSPQPSYNKFSRDVAHLGVRSVEFIATT